MYILEFVSVSLLFEFYLYVSNIFHSGLSSSLFTNSVDVSVYMNCMCVFQPCFSVLFLHGSTNTGSKSAFFL